MCWLLRISQSKLLLGDSNGIIKPSRGRPTLKLHKDLEAYLGRYSGLMLYLKEMDEAVYEKLCVVSSDHAVVFSLCDHCTGILHSIK